MEPKTSSQTHPNFQNAVQTGIMTRKGIVSVGIKNGDVLRQKKNAATCMFVANVQAKTINGQNVEGSDIYVKYL